jgi:lysine/ornithine N-monooxygenase
VPKDLSPVTASGGAFDGIVVHSSEFRSRLEDFLAVTAPDTQAERGDVVVVGGGKSAMEYVELRIYMWI